MRTHTGIVALRYRGTGLNIYLEIGFDAREDTLPGAQWLTIQKRQDADAGRQTSALLPRDLMKEQEILIGNVPRLVAVEADPSSPERRRIGLSLGRKSYSITRHTRMEDGSVSSELVFPFPDESQESSEKITDLWSA